MKQQQLHSLLGKSWIMGILHLLELRLVDGELVQSVSLGKDGQVLGVDMMLDPMGRLEVRESGVNDICKLG